MSGSCVIAGDVEFPYSSKNKIWKLMNRYKKLFFLIFLWIFHLYYWLLRAILSPVLDTTCWKFGGFSWSWRRKIFEKIAGWWIFSDWVAAYVAGNFEFKHLKVITFSGVVNARFVNWLLLTIYRFYTK